MNIFRKEVGIKVSFLFFDFACLCLMFLCYLPSSQKWEVCSQVSLSCFRFFYSLFLCIWQDALSIYCPLCLSCLATFYYLGASYAQLHASLHVSWSHCSHTFAKSPALCLAVYFFVGYTMLIHCL